MEWKLFFECTRQQGAAEGAADEGVGLWHFEFFWSSCPFGQQKSQRILLLEHRQEEEEEATIPAQVEI